MLPLHLEKEIEHRALGLAISPTWPQSGSSEDCIFLMLFLGHFFESLESPRHIRRRGHRKSGFRGHQLFEVLMNMTTNPFRTPGASPTGWVPNNRTRDLLVDGVYSIALWWLRGSVSDDPTSVQGGVYNLDLQLRGKLFRRSKKLRTLPRWAAKQFNNKTEEIIWIIQLYQTSLECDVQ